MGGVSQKDFLIQFRQGAPTTKVNCQHADSFFLKVKASFDGKLPPDFWAARRLLIWTPTGGIIFE